MAELIERGLPCPECKSSDARAEYADNYYCFSCHRSTQKQKSKPSKWVKIEELPEGDLALPSDFTYTLTGEEKAYLYSLHFTDQLIAKYKIGHSDNVIIDYHPKIKARSSTQWKMSAGSRLILPAYNKNNELLFYEAKALDKTQKMKYISKGGKADLFQTSNLFQPFIVIVEDMISAMRIGAQYPAVALRGTHISDKQLLVLAAMSDNYIVWLDSDKPGQQAFTKISKKLRWIGAVDQIITKKDPKQYSNRAIKQLIEKGR